MNTKSKLKTYFYILTIFFASCNNDKKSNPVDVSEEHGIETVNTVKTNVQPADSLNFITNCDTIPLELLEFSRQRTSLLTFQSQTYIHCSPSNESQIIDSIPTNTEIVSWKPIKRSYKPEKIERDGKLVTVNKGEENWYETKLNGQTGYLFESGLTIKKLTNTIRFGEKSNEYKYQLLSFNPKNNTEIVDSMDLNRNHGYEIEPLLYNGLDLCQGIIRYRDFRQSCPGTSTTTFIAINNKGALKKVISAHYGEASTSTVYFPLKFKSGKTLLVADGNVREIFNYHSGELNTFEYKEELNIPIHELIVEIITKYSGTLEVPEEATVISNDTVYYQWDGTELNEIEINDNNGP